MNRGHTTRFDFPRILQLDRNLPQLEVEENPSVLFGFISLCRLFQNFGQAMDGDVQQRTHDYFVAMHSRLQEIKGISGNAADLQKADFILTQQWMRIVLWKMSMYHIRLPADSADEGLSLSFPNQVARNIVQNLSILPTHIVEAHGLGMVSTQSQSLSVWEIHNHVMIWSLASLLFFPSLISLPDNQNWPRLTRFLLFPF